MNKWITLLLTIPFILGQALAQERVYISTDRPY